MTPKDIKEQKEALKRAEQIELAMRMMDNGWTFDPETGKWSR